MGDLEKRRQTLRLFDKINRSFQTHQDRISVYNGTQTLTYSQLALNISSRGLLLQSILQQFPPNPNGHQHIVGLFFHNPVDLLITLLTCIAKRIPYIVIDPASPPQRNAFILHNSAVQICLTDSRNVDPIGQSKFVFCPPLSPQIVKDDITQSQLNIFEPRTPEDKTYSIYTSGSTGQPKGINHTWAEVESNITWMTNEYPLNPTNNVLQLIPFYSDPSLRQLLWPLSSGASVTLLPTSSSRSAVDNWTLLLIQRQVTDVFILPSLLNNWVDYIENSQQQRQLFKLERVFCVGEPLLTSTASKLIKLFPNVACYNQYGVSEISGNLTSHKFQPEKGSKKERYVPIGKPLEHVEFYLVDSNGNSVDEGILAVRVDGMEGAYVNNVESHRFFQLQEKTFFLTGDIARIGKDLETLAFRGREDFQLKVTGHRVELLEIQAVLSSAEGVKEACVVVERGTLETPVIVGYFTGAEECDPETFLQDRLPLFMIPARLSKLSALPRLPNGKVDRVALETLAGSQEDSHEEHSMTPNEAKVLQLFQKVFQKVKGIHRNSDFFQLGGNSLLTFQLAQLLSLTFGTKVSVQVILESKTVGAIASNILASEASGTNADVSESSTCPQEGEAFPLTPLQLAYLVGREDGDEEPPIHDYLEFSCRPFPDLQTLQTSLNKVVARHEMLRSVLVDLKHSKAQTVLTSVPQVSIQTYDLEGHSEEVKVHLESVRNQMSHQMFDLRRFPSFDIRLSRTASCDYLHLSFDGFFLDAKSFQVILKDWSVLYGSPEGSDLLPPLTFSFQKYLTSMEQYKTVNASLYARDEEYWKDRITTGNFPTGPQLPLTINMGGIGRRSFCRHVSSIPQTMWNQIRQRSVEEFTSTPNALLLTTFARVISRFSASQHFALNLTVDTRLPIHPDVGNLVGNFTSTVLLEVTEDLVEGPLRDGVKGLHGQLTKDLDHVSFSGVEVQRTLMTLKGEVTKFPVVFTNLLGVDRNYAGTLLNGHVTSTTFHATQTPQVWIDCKVYEDQRGLVVEWDCLEGRFPPGFLQDMHQMYLRDLEATFDPLGLEEFQDNDLKVKEELYNGQTCCLHELFYAAAEAHKDEMAVISSRNRLTYGDLRELTCRVKGHLYSRGVRRGDVVGVLMDKGWEQVVATLGILSAGGAYVPLDPSWPLQRIQVVLEKCSVSKVIVRSTGEEGGEKLEGFIDAEGISIEHLMLPFDGPEDAGQAERPEVDDLAYVIFTSGTTGTPKGVAVSHRGAVNTIRDMNARCGVGPGDRVLGISELHFDLSVYDVFGTLGVGATLVVVGGEERREPAVWARLVRKERVTVWNSVPALLQILVDFHASRPAQKEELPFPALRWVWLSGDRIPLALPKAARALAPPTLQILSLGGATEASIWSICHPIDDPLPPEMTSIPYGRAMTGQSVFVLDKQLRRCPAWVKGQIHIGGVGLALGYWGDAEKTATSFFVHPRTGQRLYRTGDFGRYLPDGVIEFLGREDDQVKVNGVRIELEEVKRALLGHHLLSDALVTLLEVNGRPQLAAFVKPTSIEPKQISVDVEELFLFKKSQPGLRKVTGSSFPLPKSSNSTFDLLTRKSHRAFDPERISQSDISQLLTKSLARYNSTPLKGPLTLDDLSDFLTPLAQLRHDPTDLPKYSYASAGNLYPIQVYLEVGNKAVSGLEGGFHYYDPVRHQLTRLRGPAHPTDPAGLSFSLVGKPGPLEKVYGGTEGLVDELMWLNAGYLLGALPCDTNWTLKNPSSQDQLDLRVNFDLSPKDIPLVTLTWNGHDQTNLKDILAMPQVSVAFKESGGKGVTSWMTFSPTKVNGRKVNIVKPENVPQLENLSTDSAFLLGESTVAVCFLIDPANDLRMTRLSSGFWSHRLMTSGVNFDLGFCPIGNLPCPLTCHALFGGRVSKASALSTQTSSPQFPRNDSELSQKVMTYISNLLPGNMTPRGIKVLTQWPLTDNGKVDLVALKTSWTSTEPPESLSDNSTRPLDSSLGDFLLPLVADVLRLTRCSLNDNFFLLGGSSISAVQLVSLIRSKMSIETITVGDVFTHPVLRQLLHVLRQKLITPTHTTLKSIQRVPQSRDFPLSHAQEGLFFLHHLSSNSGGIEYNVPLLLHLTGQVDLPRLTCAFRSLITRHSVLRSKFYVDHEGLPKSDVLGETEIPLLDIPLVKVSSHELLQKFIQDEITRPFDLSQPPLLRASLVTLSSPQESSAVLVAVIHHIISDGSSVGLLASELSHLYNTQGPLPPLPVEYKDYATWERSEDPSQATLTYWRTLLSSVEPLNLPTQLNRPKEFTNHGNTITFGLNGILTTSLKDLAGQSGSTLYCVLLTLAGSVLSRYASQQDVCIGSPVANRFSRDLEGLVGLFVNSVVHRIAIGPQQTFQNVLRDVTRSVINSFKHFCPFETVVQTLGGTQRDLSRTPLFQVMLTLQNIHSTFKPTLKGLEVEELEITTPTAKYDLSWIFKETGDSINCTLEYYADAFSREFVEQLGQSFVYHAECVLKSLQDGSEGSLRSLPVSQVSTSALLNQSYQFQAQETQLKSLIEVFEDQADKYKDKEALREGSRSLTYGELNDLATCMSKQLSLLETHTIIPIYSTDKFSSISVLFGVLKGHKAYVILDSQLPISRIQGILQDINSPVLLLDCPFQDIPQDRIKQLNSLNCNLIPLDTLTNPHPSKNASKRNPWPLSNPICSVIYTSGTTGVPKGVLIPHRAVLRLVRNTNYIQFTPEDVVAQISPLSFDAANFEIFGALLSGGTLLVIPKPILLEPNVFSEQILRNQVSIMLLVTSLFNAQLQVCPQVFKKLRVLVLGGEEPRVALVRKLYESGPHTNPQLTVLNAYGPTENGTITTTQEITPEVLHAGFVPIGKPISGTTCFVLDEWGNEVPPWGVGELLVGGQGLAQGYLNRETQTKERFVEYPAESGELVYKTGDYVSVDLKGRLRFHGRRDGQVKVRGHRVEIDEVIELLGRLEGVGQVAVITQKSNTDSNDLVTSLAAFFVLLDPERSANDLRRDAEELLPSFMLPQKFLILPGLPLTSNGKVNHKRLEEILLEPEESKVKSPEVKCPVETWLKGFWEDELLVPNADETHNFFRVGGHSLLALTLLHKVNERWGSQVTMKEFFSNPTIQGLRSSILKSNEKATAGGTPFQVDLFDHRHAPFPLTPMQTAYLIGRELTQDSSSAHLYFELTFKPLDLPALQESLNALITRHEMLRCVLVKGSGHVSQQILRDTPPYVIPVQEEVDPGSSLLQWRHLMSHQFLDLYSFPTFDIRLTRSLSLGSKDTLHLSFDGMFTDALSLDIFLREWSHLYSNPKGQSPFSDLQFSFRDYVFYLQAEKASKNDSAQEQLLKDRAAKFPLGPQLPRRTLKDPQTPPRYSSKVSLIPTDTWDTVKSFALQNNISPTSILLWSYSEVLSRYSSSPDFAINLTLFNRPPLHPEVNKVIGEFTDVVLAQVSPFPEEHNLLQRIKSVQDGLLTDMEFMSGPYSSLDLMREVGRVQGGVAEDGGGLKYPYVFTSILNLPRTNRNTLFNNSFLETSHSITQTPGVLIDCKVYEGVEGGGVAIEWDFRDDGAFPPGTVEAMHTMQTQLVLAISSPNRAEVVQETLQGPIQEFLDTSGTHLDTSENNTTLHDLVLRGPGLPESLAVVSSTKHLTYGELLGMVHQVGVFLKGLNRGELVGVLIPKGWEQVVAVLGVLLAGAAYVPLDPSWPSARIKCILEQCDIRRVLTVEGAELPDEVKEGRSFTDIHVILRDTREASEWAWPKVKADDLAYVIFTSGTTGTPKGVAVSHRGAVNTIRDMNARCGVGPGDRVLGISELHFDLSVYDVFGTLGAGATLVVVGGEERREPAMWARLVREERVTVWNSVPALLQILVDFHASRPAQEEELPFPALRWVWLSGDRIPLALPKAARALAPPTLQILSLGGATEASIWSICHPIDDPLPPEMTSIPYGRAMTGQSVFVLDKQLRRCPAWVKGQIHIGGVGLALGYWGDAAKTAASFFVHPRTGQRLYRTGDFGRYLPDGVIEFLGREDDQVKVNGVRIELEEVKRALLGHHLLSDALVTLLEVNGRPQLAAFIKPKNTHQTNREGSDVQELFMFKKSQPGLREVKRSSIVVTLKKRSTDDLLAHRKSHRTFQPDRITPSDITKLITKTLAQRQNSKPLKGPLTLDDLSDLLTPLAQLRHDPTDLPKYSYASAGNLYPIQVYLEVGNKAVSGLEGGFHYYDPVRHQLTRLRGPAHPTDPAGLSFSLVGKRGPLEKVYGGTDGLVEELMWLNAGYLLGALPCDTNWTLKNPSSQDQLDLRANFDLSPNDSALVTLTWNGDAQTSLQDILTLPQVSVAFKESGGKEVTSWMTFNPTDPKKIKVLKPANTPQAKDLPGDSAFLFGESTVAIFFPSADPFDLQMTRLSSGFWSQRLMTSGVNFDLGFCPIGNLPCPSTCHALFGGRVSEASALSPQTSSLQFPRNDSELSQKVMTYISNLLPSQMVPSILQVLLTFPLTPNGKVDLPALQRLSLSTLPTRVSSSLRVTPFDALETQLLDLWEAVVGVALPLNTDFFVGGGDSLGALKLALLINETFPEAPGVNVAWIYEHQTIEQQAKTLLTLLDPSLKRRQEFILFNRGGTKRPLILIHPGRDSAFAYSRLATELGPEQPIVALEYHNLFASDEFDLTVEQMATRYVNVLEGIEGLECSPYLLGGWSFGGLVAFEMAKQLEQHRESSVQGVFMFDTPFPGSQEDDDLNSTPLDLLDLISDPEKQLYASLNPASQDTYRRSAFIELQAIQMYRVPHREAHNQFRIFQFLPCQSPLTNYAGWGKTCASFQVLPIPGDHSSILRNPEHRSCLVSSLKETLNNPSKLVFLLFGHSFQGHLDFSEALKGHEFIALVNTKHSEAFQETFNCSGYSQIVPVKEAAQIGYLTQLDLEQCELIIRSHLTQRQPRGNVYVISMDEGNVSNAAELRNRFKLPGILPQDALNFRDKFKMKRVLQEGKVNVPKFLRLNIPHEPTLFPEYYEQLVSKVNSPFILKPTNSGGSYGVIKINTFQDFLQAIQSLAQNNLEYEVEEFLSGDLFHVDIALSSRSQGSPVFSETALYFHPFMGFNSCHDYIGSSTAIPPDVSNQLVSFCVQAIRILGGSRGLFHCEVFRDSITRELTFLELGSRVPGALIPKMYEGTHQVNLYELDVLLQMDETPGKLKYKRCKWGMWGIYFCHKSGKVLRVAQEFPEESQVQRYFEVNDFYDHQKATYKVVGTLVLVHEDFNTIQKNSKSLPNIQFMGLST